MIRGTTPTHKFNISFSADRIKDIRITYAQDGETVVEKGNNDCSMEGNVITTSLTQEETLRFHEKRPVELQIKVLTKEDNVLATRVYTLNVDRVLNEEVLT